jgi:hypothetical protein
MAHLSRVVEIELIGPTSIGLRLTDEGGIEATDQLVISPANFITDFSVFLTAIRAAGETRPVDSDCLCRSWQEARKTLRRRLIEEDPWAEQPISPPDEEAIVAVGEERLRAIQSKRQMQKPPSANQPPSSSH